MVDCRRPEKHKQRSIEIFKTLNQVNMLFYQHLCMRETTNQMFQNNGCYLINKLWIVIAVSELAIDSLSIIRGRVWSTYHLYGRLDDCRLYGRHQLLYLRNKGFVPSYSINVVSILSSWDVSDIHWDNINATTVDCGRRMITREKWFRKKV